MNKWLRNILLFVSVLFLFAENAIAGGTINDLDISLAAEKSTIVGQQDIRVRVTISNNTGEVIEVPRFQLPVDKISTPLFSVTGSDGSPARYVGAMIKWSPKALSETVKFAPNTQREFVVELGRSYKFVNGTYKIQYVGIGLPPTSGKPKTSSAKKLSSPIVITVQDRASSNVDTIPSPKNYSVPSTGQMAKQTYASCTLQQMKLINRAAKGALGYARNASKYFYYKTNTTATARYLTWFGAPVSTYWSTAQDDFLRIYAALYYETLNFDCSCTESGVYAYVYPTEPFNIYVCQAFWAAPVKGTDSKAGTIIHEMSHFDVLAGTNDWVYGQYNARALAQGFPEYAVNNADNHEYFAENRPRLR